MSTLWLLAEWALRSAVLVLTVAVLLKVLRVEDPAVRLAAWTATLIGSLLLPAISPSVPRLGVPMGPRQVIQSTLVNQPAPALHGGAAADSVPRKSIDWPAIAVGVYGLGACALLLRLFTGLVLSRRMVRRSRPTGLGTRVHESDDLTAPATLGIVRPVVVLPADWRDWEPAALEAILAHERSHIRRHDPAVQLLSAIHRALLWFSPLSWFLHTRIVRVAEDASDDAALAAARDRVTYAEVLLQFVQRVAAPVRWEGVAMARCGKADARIHRILDGTSISRGMSRIGWAAVVVMALPLVYLSAAVRPVTPVMQVAVASTPPAASHAPAVAAPVSTYHPVPTLKQRLFTALTVIAAAEPPAEDAPEQSGSDDHYLIVTGNSSTGWYDNRDRPQIEEWIARYGPNFVWFHHDGNQYLVSDPKVMDELDRAMAPQREVNRMQSEVNRQQSVVNSHQSTVNDHQSGVNQVQRTVNAEQDQVNRRQREGAYDHEAQSRVNAHQAEVNKKQRVVNEEQSVVNGEQQVVNREQEKVNVEQRRINPLISAAVRAILQPTIANGQAVRVPAR